MSRLLTATAWLTAVALAQPVMAEPATTAGAASIESALQRYLGTTPGVVTVEPKTDSYLARIDIAPLVAKIPEPGLAFSMTPVELTLTALGDGRWQVSEDGPFSVSLNAPPVMAFKMEFAEVSFSGVFDEAMGAFETSKGTATDGKVHQEVDQPGQRQQTIDYKFKSIAATSTAKPASGGGVDATTHSEITGFEQTGTPGGPGGPGMTVTGLIDSQSTDGTWKALRSREILDLIAFFVAHPSHEALLQDEGALKAALRATLPLFNSMKVSSTASNIAIQTPFGSGSLDSANIELAANGLVTDGRVREKLALSGLKLPLEIIPAWAHPLLPKNATIDFEVSGFDAGAAAFLALDEMSVAGSPKPGFPDRFMAALLPNQTVNVTLGPGGVSGDDYALDMNGDLVAGPGGPPTGTASLVVTGMDAILSALNAGPKEMASQVVPGLLMARGLAKADGDKLVWKFDLAPGGKVSVNGNDLSGLMGR